MESRSTVSAPPPIQLRGSGVTVRNIGTWNVGSPPVTKVFTVGLSTQVMRSGLFTFSIHTLLPDPRPPVRPTLRDPPRARVWERRAESVSNTESTKKHLGKQNTSKKGKRLIFALVQRVHPLQARGAALLEIRLPWLRVISSFQNNGLPVLGNKRIDTVKWGKRGALRATAARVCFHKHFGCSHRR